MLYIYLALLGCFTASCPRFTPELSLLTVWNLYMGSLQVLQLSSTLKNISSLANVVRCEWIGIKSAPRYHLPLDPAHIRPEKSDVF